MMLCTVSNSELAEIAALDAQVNRSAWSLFNYQQSAQDDNHQILGAYDEDDQIIGICVFSRVLDEAEILQIFVRHEKQRNGYATILLEQVCQLLQIQQVNQIFLEVMVGNTSAINLYEKLGFNVIGNRKNYYKVDGKYIDALLMAKQL